MIKIEHHIKLIKKKKKTPTTLPSLASEQNKQREVNKFNNKKRIPESHNIWPSKLRLKMIHCPIFVCKYPGKKRKRPRESSPSNPFFPTLSHKKQTSLHINFTKIVTSVSLRLPDSCDPLSLIPGVLLSPFRLFLLTSYLVTS